MEYISTKEASEKWGISTTRITILANQGRIPGAQRLGKSWLIPAGATKPSERKSTPSKHVQQDPSEFSFPLYYFRPDWNQTKEAQLSEQQYSLLLAEKAVLECRFSDAFSHLVPILNAPEDVVTEIGGLWNAGLCCIALNMPNDFSKYYLRLQLLLASDFPHRNDLVIVLESLKTYVESLGAVSQSDTFNMDIHDQALPLSCLQVGYTNLSKEAMEPGSANTALLELNLRFLQTTSSVISMEMMHCYLLGIYFIRQDYESADRHANAIVQIAFENKLYFPLISFYRYFATILSPVIEQYPKDFQNLCNEMIAKYNENFSAFFSSIDEFAIISQFTDADYPFIYATLMDLPNSAIADKLGVSEQTVKRRLTKIYDLMGVSSKKEMKEYLHNYM